MSAKISQTWNRTVAKGVLEILLHHTQAGLLLSCDLLSNCATQIRKLPLEIAIVGIPQTSSNMMGGDGTFLGE